MHHAQRYVKGKLAEQGVSLQYIAESSGEDPRTVSHVLRGGRKNRALPIFIEVAKATGIPLGYLQEMYGEAA